ncbi:MAG: hypothetical protein ACTSUE_04255 [Promethearchaeota archaeon]
MATVEDLIEVVKEKFKGKEVSIPEKDSYVIIIKEELVYQETGEKNYEVGIGKAMVFPAKVSINGRVFRSNELDDIKEGSVIMKIRDLTKEDGRQKVLIVEIPKALNRAVDQASWDKKFKTIDDIIEVIKTFDPSKSGFSLF